MPYSKAHEPDACGYTVYTASGEWAQGVYTRVHRSVVHSSSGASHFFFFWIVPEHDAILVARLLTLLLPPFLILRDKSIILAMRAWQGLPTNVSNADIGLPSHCT